MKVTLSIMARSRSGYQLELHEEPPRDFVTRFRPKIEELNYYEESEGDVDVLVHSQDLRSEILALEGERSFEITFSGTLVVDIDDDQVDRFREISQEEGLDYFLVLVSDDGEETLSPEDDWEFLQNYNLLPDFPDEA